MFNKCWEVGFTSVPPCTWLNGPNGHCMFRGRSYFYQYDCDWPTVDQKAWRAVQRSCR